MLEKGTTVAGYRIDGVLGQGGMGVVYEATQLSLDRKVALKLLAAHLSEDPLFRERFRREGLIQAAIDHPHIVTVYEAGDTEHGLFMAMRLVRGPNLKDMIVSRELDAGRALRILRPIAEALDAAHEAGLIHRDIKPQNILVSGRDHAYLADFGLTKAPGEKSLTKTGQFVGTLDYISPEQIRGLKATTASDIYALAAVLYEALTGVVPYPKESEAAVLFAHMSDTPPKVTDQRPELPAGLDDVIGKAMAKDPGERHRTATALLEDAERAFDRRLRGVISTPGPIEAPEETGIRPSEGEVRTRESAVQDSDEIAATTAAGGPEATKLADAGDQTKLADAAEATKVAAAGDATKLASAADATRLGAAAAGATRTAATAPVAAPPGAAPTPPPARAERRGGAGPLVGAAAVAAVVLAVVGYLVGSSGRGSDEPSGTSSAVAGNVKLRFPDDWSEGARVADVPGLELADSIELAPPGATGGAGVVAGEAAASGPTLLPASLRANLEGALPKGEPVKLGDLEAYRYDGVDVKGLAGPVTLYVVPTSGGVATLACVTAGDDAARLRAGCDSIAASLELRDAEPYPLGPSQQYADAVNGALARLNTARAAGRARLGAAARPDGQARAARDLARAYRTAAGALRRAAAPPQAREANAAIAAALGRAAHAYERLAQAAARGNRGGYSSARGAASRGESAVRRALAGLSRLGYDVGTS